MAQTQTNPKKGPTTENTRNPRGFWNTLEQQQIGLPQVIPTHGLHGPFLRTARLRTCEKNKSTKKVITKKILYLHFVFYYYFFLLLGYKNPIVHCKLDYACKSNREKLKNFKGDFRF
ncbi:hypothetical protein V6Z11_A08G200100 [Gossypium hirsutum]